MTLKYAAGAAGALDGTIPVNQMDGRFVNAKVERIRAIITMAADAITDQFVIGELPPGAAFAYGLITSDTSLGTTVAAIGTSAVHAGNGQHRGAAVFTAIDTPTLYGKASAVSAVPPTGRTLLYLTWATAALPASGTLIIDTYFTKRG